MRTALCAGLLGAAVGLTAALPTFGHDDSILTCGLEDCSVLDDPLFGASEAQLARIAAAFARLDAMSAAEVTELVALSIGQVGCLAGWPSDDLNIYDYYADAGRKMARNLGMQPEDVGRVGYLLEDAFMAGLYDLRDQGRMVTVTDDPEALIPRACAGG